jgi:hypothetical protein
MQALSLPRGTPTTPHHQHNNTALPTQHHGTNPTIHFNNTDNIEARPAKRLTQPSNGKPLLIQNKNNSTSTPPSYSKSQKQNPILDHRQIKARISKAQSRATYREKTHGVGNQHPLSDYWHDIFSFISPNGTSPQ